MKALKILGIVLVLGAIVAMSIPRGEGSKKRGKGPKVYVEVVERGELSRDVSATGTLEPKESIQLSAEVLGTVLDVFVVEGQAVEKGELLVRIDRGKLQEDIDRLAAQQRMDRITIEGAELRLRKARTDLERLKTLHERGILSSADLENADLAAEQARVDAEGTRERLTQTQASLRALKNDLAKTEVHAPLTGTVLKIQRRPGEGVAPGMGGAAGTALVKIGDLSEILVEVAIEEAEVALIAVEQEAKVEVDALEGQVFDAVVSEVAVEGAPGKRGTVVFDAKLKLLAPDPALRAGMSARADIGVGRETDALIVSQAAVVEREGKDVSFVETEGTVAQVEVSTGSSNATHVVITDGLKEGDRVVTGPYRTLKDLEADSDVRAELEADDDDSAP